MNYTCFSIALVAVMSIVSNSAAAANDQGAEELGAAQKFYESYLQAGYNFDASLLDMYGSNALSHITTFTPDNTAVDKTLAADEIRQALQNYVTNGSANNIKIRYENIAYSLEPAGVKVIAKVIYPHLCYTDETYWALLARNANKEYRIKEEFLRIPEKSLCKAE